MKNLPIGIQSFEDIRKNDYLYIDKTAYVWKLVSTGKVYFLNRPRRFGKSLLVSTLEAYFLGKKELFHGLAIEVEENKKSDPWVAYPVIHFSFAAGDYSIRIGMEDLLNSTIRQTIVRYGLAESDIFGETLPVRFQNLIISLKEKTGLPVVVLVDEYDKSLLAGLEEHPEMETANRKLFRAFFSVLKDTDQYLKFVFVTGVTKFSKVSIFSDLNQLRDISLLPDYAAVCGITEQEITDYLTDEIEAMASVTGTDSGTVRKKLAQMYDGYHFSKAGDGVYNPFSLFSALAGRNFGRYWFETGTPEFLIRSLNRFGINLQDFSSGIIATEEELTNYRADFEDAIPMFYQSGYLTIAGYDSQFGEYKLRFPNEEVKFGFYNDLIPTVNAQYIGRTGKFSAGKMTRELRQGAAESVMQMIQALLASIPYYEGTVPEYEQQWRNLVYVIFAVLGQYVQTEVHSANGRSDCIVETDSYVYVIEFKQDKTADEALRQIDDNGYALPYMSSGKRIVKIGANFSSQRRTLDEWKIAEK